MRADYHHHTIMAHRGELTVEFVTCRPCLVAKIELAPRLANLCTMDDTEAGSEAMSPRNLPHHPLAIRDGYRNLPFPRRPDR